MALSNASVSDLPRLTATRPRVHPSQPARVWTSVSARTVPAGCGSADQGGGARTQRRRYEKSPAFQLPRGEVAGRRGSGKAKRPLHEIITRFSSFLACECRKMHFTANAPNAEKD